MQFSTCIHRTFRTRFCFDATCACARFCFDFARVNAITRARAQHSARLSFRLILDDLKLRAILESGCNVRKFTQRDRDNAKDDTLSPSLSTEGYMGAEWYWIPCNHHSSPCIRALNSRIPLGLLRVLLIVRFLSFARRRSRTSDHRRETIKRVINSAKISAF